jgi:ApaG protein
MPSAPAPSQRLQGLQVVLEKVIHDRDAPKLPPDRPHAFIYFIRITNLTPRTVRLLGRRWILNGESGHREILEGEGIGGETPLLAPGQEFTYHAYHATAESMTAVGSIHGEDCEGNRVHARIPPFAMTIPWQDPQLELPF